MFLKSLIKLLSLILLIFIGGLAGGLVAFYYLIAPIIFNTNSLNPLTIAQKQETIIRENEAIVDALNKVIGTTIYIEATPSKGNKLYGSGIIITSDGLAALPYTVYPPGAQALIYVDGKKTSYTVLQRDKAANVVLVKLEGANWPTASFAALENIKLGQQIFIAGKLSPETNFTNEGIIRTINNESLGTNIKEISSANGSPLFDIEGNIIGIIVLDANGFANAIPISKIKNIAGL